MILSIIGTFYNKEKVMKVHLDSVLKFDYEDVQLIWVNDGSKDGTLQILKEYAQKIKNAKVQIINQENRGPGGARNAGLDMSIGKYVWFTDGDDEVLSEIYPILHKESKDFDFIDFLVVEGEEKYNTMGIKEQEYLVGSDISKEALYKQFGRLWTKLFSRDFLIKNKIYYPENCLYEDNMFIFYLPLLIEKFKVINQAAYKYNPNIQTSFTMNFSLRSYDRLFTALYGLKKGIKLIDDDLLKEIIEEKFYKLFYKNTVKFEKRDLLLFNFKKIYNGLLIRVFYKRVCSRYKIRCKLGWLNNFIASISFRNYESVYNWFEKIHTKEWNKPIIFK